MTAIDPKRTFGIFGLTNNSAEIQYERACGIVLNPLKSGILWATKEDAVLSQKNGKKRATLSALLLPFILSATSKAQAQPAPPFWQPDEQTVLSIEASLVLPSLSPWTPGPLASYSRYYTGWTEHGHRIIAGDFLRGTNLTKDQPGIYVYHYGDVHHLVLGGGCDNILFRYDVDAHQTTWLKCYGLG
jgi:hypothetical protein